MGELPELRLDFSSSQVAEDRIIAGKVDGEAVGGKHSAEASVCAAALDLALRGQGDVVVEELAELHLHQSGLKIFMSANFGISLGNTPSMSYIAALSHKSVPYFIIACSFTFCVRT